MSLGFKNLTWLIPALGLLALFASGISAGAENPTTYSDVAPIFSQNCSWCHNWNIGASSGFTQQTFGALLDGAYKGGGHERVIIPGDPQNSLLVQYIEGRKQPRMPLGNQLSTADIAKIRKWIADGALADAKTPVEHDIAVTHLRVTRQSSVLYLSCRAPKSKSNVSLRVKLVDETSGRILAYDWPEDRDGVPIGPYDPRSETGRWKTWQVAGVSGTAAHPQLIAIHLYVSNYWRPNLSAPNDASLDGTLFFLTFRQLSDADLNAREIAFKATAAPATPPVKEVRLSYILPNPSDVKFGVYPEGSDIALYSNHYGNIGAGSTQRVTWKTNFAKVKTGTYLARMDYMNGEYPEVAEILFELRN